MLLREKSNASERCLTDRTKEAAFMFQNPLSFVLTFQLFEKTFRCELVQQALIDKTV